MNSLLLTAGIAVVCALIAALVAPFFIDWGNYREFFEARASQLLRTPVRIEGTLSARILPRPRLEATDISLGEDGSFTARGLTLRVGLTPLMSGNLKVERVRIEGPQATVRIGADGTVAGFADLAPQGEADAVSLDAIEVVDGRLVIIGQGGAEQVFEGIALAASAGNLDGPYKAEGSLRYNGETHDIIFATGRWTPDGGIRTKLSVTRRGSPHAFDADGTTRIDSAVPVFIGRVRLERVADENAPGNRWLFRGDAEADPAQVRFTAMTLGFGPDDRQFTLEGAGRLDLAGTPRFDAVLGARQADLDRTLGEGAPVSLSAVLSRIGAASRNAPPIAGRIGLDLERMVLGGNLVDDVSLDVAWTGDTWRIAQASADVPGDTRISLAGDLKPGTGAEGRASFAGAARLTTTRGQVFADWLGEDLKAYTGWLGAGADVRADLSVDAEHIAFDRLQLTLDGRTIGGKVAVDLPDGGSPGRVDIDLKGEAVRIEALQALWAGSRAGGGDAATRMPDLTLRLDTDALVADAVTAREVTIDARIAGGKLDIQRLEIGDLGGARLSARGGIGGADGDSRGDIDFTIDAQSLAGAASLLDVLGWPGTASAVAQRQQALAPFSMNGQVRTGADGQTSISLSGNAADTAVRLQGEVTGALDDPAAARIDLEAELQASDAGQLVRQFGLPASVIADADAATMKVTASGVARDGLNVSGELVTGGTRAGVGGSVRIDADGGRSLDLKTDVTSEDLLAFLSMFDLVAPRIGEEAVPARLGGRIEGRDPFALRDLSLALGPAASAALLTGQGTLSMGKQGRAHRIDADLSGDSASLPAILDALFGAGRFARASQDGETAFSTQPFSISLPGRFEINADLKLDHLLVAPGLTLDQAGGELVLRGDGFRLDQVSGSAHGGTARGALSLGVQSGNLVMDGRLRLEGARLEELVWQRGGRAVASGALDADVTFSGNGRSFSAIMSSLAGEGAASVSKGSIAGLNPVAFDKIVNAADQGTQIDEARAEELLAAYLDQGALDFDRADMTFSIAGGVARATRFAIDGDGLDSFVTGQADLAALTLNSAWSVRAPPDPGAPDQVREFGIVFRGALDDPARSFDVAPLIGYLTIRAFEREVERLEELQLDIHDRGRIQRELDVLILRRLEARQKAEDLARRERERARWAREEAARKAAEEAAAAAAQQGQIVVQPLQLPAPTAPALSQPIEIAPAPGVEIAPASPFPQESRDPQLPQTTAPVPTATGQAEGQPNAEEAAAEPPQPAPQTRPQRRSRTDPMAGFSGR
ncbi:MAG: AsmA family protein [Rhodobiaceae bacterium]|nr:AsmA family protein [Rhodobiaceae bacterium]